MSKKSQTLRTDDSDEIEVSGRWLPFDKSHVEADQERRGFPRKPSQVSTDAKLSVRKEPSVSKGLAALAAPLLDKAKPSEKRETKGTGKPRSLVTRGYSRGV